MTNEMTAKQKSIREKRISNLIPYRKGQSGNPAGRKKKEDCLLSCIKEELTKAAPNGETKEQLIAGVLVDMASRGNVKAIELLLSYLHAKPSQGIDLTSQAPLRIEFIRGNGNATD
uniref:DUF5681 domain-containing protein n=1 Tax=viral metagenome TaxID=1070528 RepID=A0A6M3K435_9ZZZZ